MNKILSLLLVVSMVFITSNVSAQRATLLPLNAGDSISASSGLDSVSKVVTATAGYSAASFTVVATKISGTVSLKFYLWGSNDGTNYTLTDSSTAFADQTTNERTFTKVTTPYVYYKMEVRPATIAATTQVVRCRFYYLFRRHD